MEDYSGRRSATAVGFLRRGSSISLRNQSNEERADQYVNRPGSSNRLNHMKARHVDSQEKPRYVPKPFQSSSSKFVPGSSSRAPLRRSREEKQRKSSLAEGDVTDSSNGRAQAERLERSKKVVTEDVDSDPRQADPEDSLSMSTTEGGGSVVADYEASDSAGSLETSSAHEAESFVGDTPSSSKLRRQKDKELSLGRPEGYSSSFVHRPNIPINSTAGGTGAQRRGLKNLGCSSISDVLPAGCSSDSVLNRRAEAMRKRAADAESSSRSRGLNVQSGLGHPPSTHTAIAGPRVRPSEQIVSQQAIRGSRRNFQDSAVSVRTRRPSSRDTRMRLSEEREDIMFPLRETFTRVREPDQACYSFDEVRPENSLRPFSVQLPHAIYSSSRLGSSSRTSRSTSTSRAEEIPSQMFHGLLQERDGYRRINMEGITEVLHALDRIEQDEELTYEQLLVLETNLFLGGFAFHDQYREMRMDIDNMSYEELLALEEKMGSVSTALSEEQFVDCLKISMHRPSSLATEVNRSVVGDGKCSICQEEYIQGEKVGTLGCEHQYHVCCIHQWLKQKNWCPICKASAMPSKMDKRAT